MTIEQQPIEQQLNFIDNQFKIIDKKLKDVNLSENERQILLEQRAEYEEQSEELYDDNLNTKLQNSCE